MNTTATPNHALQRTAPHVTVAASRRPTTQLPRRAPRSLSLGSLGVATRLVKRSIPILAFSALIVGCAHHTQPHHVEFTPPWRTVADGVASLAEHHAPRSTFERFRESSTPPARLRTFAAVERATGRRVYSPAERAQQRQWFSSAVSVWHYTFECQYSGVLFLDASGRVQHALLLG